MNNVLAVTLARGGSKGVPGKHLRMLGDKPVLDYTLEAVLESDLADNYVVSSDDWAILALAKSMGVRTIQRPDYLARDDTPTMPALKHAVEVYQRAARQLFGYIVEVRATSPFKTAEDINKATKMLIESGAESVIGVTALDDHHPARAKWLDERGRIHDFIPEPESGRRQDLRPKAYIRNGTIYALKRSALESGVLFGHEFSLGYVMPPERSVNIDTELDFALCKAILTSKGY